ERAGDEVVGRIVGRTVGEPQALGGAARVAVGVDEGRAAAAAGVQLPQVLRRRVGETREADRAADGAGRRGSGARLRNLLGAARAQGHDAVVVSLALLDVVAVDVDALV